MPEQAKLSGTLLIVSNCPFNLLLLKMPLVRIAWFCLLFSTSALCGLAQNNSEALLKAEREMFVRQLELQKKGGNGLNYDLTYHHLQLSIDPRKDTMSGSVHTKFRSLQNDLDEVSFDFRASMIVDSVKRGSEFLNFRRSGDVLTISLPNPIALNSADSVRIFYHGNPVNNPYNSYDREKRRPKNDHPSLWTLSQPYGAHAWWPCKESLEDKVDSVDVWITVPNGNKAASLGILTDSVRLNDSTLQFRWKHRYPVATYLIAVAVSNYSEFTDMVYWRDGDSMPVLNYVYPEYVPSGRDPARETIPMLHLFDSLFGPYPFRDEKYGHAQMLRGGGMEHQTMSFMSGLEYGLVAHELAHQWFGDMVTCASWSDLWLNEGFATYIAYLAYEFLKSPADARKELISIRNSAMSENNGSVYVADTLNVGRLFSGRLTYSKGALVLHMLRWKLGDDAFFSGLRAYLSDPSLAYGNARTSDLQRHLERASGMDLNEFLADWFYGEGYPTILLRWRMIGAEAELKVSQFAPSGVGYFDIPLPIQFIGQNRDTILTIQPEEGKELYRVFPGFIPDSVRFDPDLWILAKSQVFAESSIDKSIFMYPIPAGDYLLVRHPFSDVGDVRVYDANSRLLYSSQDVSGGQILRVPTAEFVPGTYVIEIEGETGTLRSRFVKVNP